jgi:hypothetical protein
MLEIYVDRPLYLAQVADFEFENTTLSSGGILSLSNSTKILRKTISIAVILQYNWNSFVLMGQEFVGYHRGGRQGIL